MQAAGLISSLTVPNGRISALAIAPDGTWLAVASGATVSIWAIDGTQRAALTGHTSAVSGLAIAPDGTWLAAGSFDGTTRIWAADGTPRVTLTGNKRLLTTVAIAPDGSWLATASGRTVQIWSADGTQRASLLSATGFGTELAIAPDGAWRAAACGKTMQIAAGDGTLGVTVANTGHKHIASMAIAPDGTWLATAGSADGTVRIWDIDGTCRATVTGRMPWVSAGAVIATRLAIAPDGSWLVAASGRMAMVLAADGTPRATLTGGFPGLAGDLLIAADSTWLALASGTMVSIFGRDGTSRSLGQVFHHATLSAGSPPRRLCWRSPRMALGWPPPTGTPCRSGPPGVSPQHSESRPALTAAEAACPVRNGDSVREDSGSGKHRSGVSDARAKLDPPRTD